MGSYGTARLGGFETLERERESIAEVSRIEQRIDHLQQSHGPSIVRRSRPVVLSDDQKNGNAGGPVSSCSNASPSSQRVVFAAAGSGAPP